MLTVKSREGDEKVVKLSDAVIVTGIAKIAMNEIKPGSYIGVSGMPAENGHQKAELTPGAKVIIFGATKTADGGLEAGRIGVGRDGITPPM